ncbi:MAG: efflux RND transporter periplasmic adaptor subunit, partial [Butyrivibrio sp.]|nr:efflux RND transporter periplasmic adaptor subunit [Butyrivibrio sp.]
MRDEENMKSKKAFFRKKMGQIKEWTLSNKKMAALLYSGIAVILILVIIVCSVNSSSKTETATYKEETVAYGALTVGITEEGTITIGTSTQTLDIDISAYSAEGDFSWGGGMGGMGGQTQTSTSSSDDDDTRVLDVEAVYVSVGQEISEGDAIARLTQDSVTSIKSELEADVADAQNTYDQTLADQALTDQSAEASYSVNLLYGDYAQSEYDAEVLSLQNAVDSAQESLDDAKEELEELQEQLTEDQTNLPTFKKVLENAEYTVNGIDKETEMYGWLTAEEAREDALENLENLEDEIESLQEQIEDQETTIKELEIALISAQKAYDLGVIEAKATYDSRVLYYTNATEYKDVTKLQSTLAVEIALDDLEQAQKKLDEFNTYVIDNEIISGYSGVISEVSISAGDELYSASSIMTVNDYEDVTVTVDVSEEDIDQTTLGSAAKVNVSAFSEMAFDAQVTEIGDATYNSSTGITTYEVTVTLSGDMSELYDGMTAEVTFITEDVEEVLYISNRAVSRENGVSYVKVMNENGSIETKEITTGFSDGTYVQVTEGLSEGDIVVIESQVDSN